jgi:hypothetical protein
MWRKRQFNNEGCHFTYRPKFFALNKLGTFYFQNVTQFHGTRVNVILINPTNEVSRFPQNSPMLYSECAVSLHRIEVYSCLLANSVTFTVPILTKHNISQWNYMGTSCFTFYSNWTKDAKNMSKIPFYSCLKCTFHCINFHENLNCSEASHTKSRPDRWRNTDCRA